MLLRFKNRSSTSKINKLPNQTDDQKRYLFRLLKKH